MNDLIYKAIKKAYYLDDYDYLAKRIYYFIYSTDMGLNDIIEYLNHRTMMTRDLMG